MADGGSPGSLVELDPDGTPTAKACILGCGLLRPPDPDGDDPKRSDPEGNPDPNPEAEPDPKPDEEAEENLNRYLKNYPGDKNGDIAPLGKP